MARTTMFPFPARDGQGGGVTIGVVEDCPPTDGIPFSFDGPVLTLHLSRPAWIRQSREDLSHEWRFTRGDLSLIPAGWRTTSWTDSTVDFMQVELGRDLVRRAGGDRPDTDLPCLFSFDDPVLRELSLSMLSEAQAHGPAARMYVESAAVVLAQRLLSLKRRSVTPAPRLVGLAPAVLRRAKEFLHAEMNRNPGVTELSAAVGMTVDHFSRMFKRSTGLAPHQYLANIRLERAKRLLAEGRVPIIDIAYEIGYANPSQFSAFFRKRTGRSPTEFRRSAQYATASAR
ncbi:MAG TPA: AraC family transcriptional regulator [Polyangia bacterium]|nr:AraC family transcriptional regulator [Polyangia bacterium]